MPAPPFHWAEHLLYSVMVQGRTGALDRNIEYSYRCSSQATAHGE